MAEDDDNIFDKQIVFSASKLNFGTLFVSLFLFLLIFFVMLTTTNKPRKDVSEKAFQSVINTFGKVNNDNIFVDNTPVFIDKKEELIHTVKEHFISYLKALAGYEIDVNDLRAQEEWVIASIPLHVNSIFEQNTGDIRQDKKQLFDQISTLLNKDVSGFKLRLQIIIGTHDYVNNIGTDKIRNAAKMVSRLSDYIIDKGVNYNRITIGLEEADLPELVLYFALQQPNDH